MTLKPITLPDFWKDPESRVSLLRAAAHRADVVAKYEASRYPNHCHIMELPRNHYNNYLIDYRVNERNRAARLDLYATRAEKLYIRVVPLQDGKYGVTAFYCLNEAATFPEYILIDVEGVSILSSKKRAWRRARKIATRYQAVGLMTSIEAVGWVWDLPRDPARLLYQRTGY